MSSVRGGGQYRDLALSEDLSEFASAIATMTKEAQKDDSEEFQKNVIAQFLSTTFDYACNTRGKVDLAIYDDEIPKVLFEVKATGNKAEFIKTPDSSLRGVANAEASAQSIDPHLQIQSYRHSEGAKRPKNPRIKGEFLDSSLRTSCYAQNDKSGVDCHDLKSPLPQHEGDLGVGKSTQRVDSHNDKWGLESKALYESILYYLREWHKHKNNDIKHIILCTAKEFYIIKGLDYHRLFVKNKDIERAYNNCDFNKGNDTSTAQFYKQVEAIINDIEGQLEFYYINVESALNNQNDLALFYALLSPSVLLQIPRYIDANTLNERFYKELLYILGLVQVEQNGKALILPSTTPNTLLHSIKRDFADKLPRDLGKSSDSNALDSRQNALDSSDLAQSHKGESTQNQSQNPNHPHKNSPNSTDIFDSHIFPLIMLWNNRILFLRLLESMLLSFRHIDKPFLDISILRDFGALNTLFFKVLAVKNRADIPPNLTNIPYLNSSLFEKSTLESQGFEIATLQSKPLKITPDSILRRDKTLREKYVGKDEQLPLLEYLFAFLHAYDFTTTPSDVQNYAKTNHDKLINSAVLGLVFEKLNGYKEGSFYTPSFITRYMCESSIRKIVVEKFQERGFKAQSLIALRNEIDINKLNDANKIFLSIRICDPAVGSGHFLVSALNELIAIKSELGLLLDCDGRRLSDIDLVLENDELLIKDSLGNALDYRIPAHEGIESHKIQKAIFYTKKELIENCLFGVDINPNSVEICKLRLWIELLKYSYYENIATKELQTLPNIDINIKCGNSLISRFDLHNSLKHIPNINKQIKDYQKLVLDYKHSNQSELKASKKDIESKIANLKETFKLTLKDPKTKASLEKAINNHIAHYGFYLLDNESILAGLNGGFHRLFGNEISLSEKEQESALESYANIMKLRKKLDSALSGEEYKNALEWRFEFPEVLSEEGDFMGFDLIIGNPPYIDYRAIDSKTKGFLNKKSMIYSISKEGSIYVYFIERAKEILSQSGNLIFINPIAYICQDSGKGLREFIDKNLTLLQMVNVSNVKVFDSASAYTCVNYFTNKDDECKEIIFGEADKKDLSDIKLCKIKQTKIENISTLLDSITTKIFEAKYPQLNEFCDIFCGLSKTGFRQGVSNRKTTKNRAFLEASDILRYGFKQGKFLNQISTYYSQEKINIFEKSEIIFMARMTNFIRCCIAPKGYFGGKVNILHNFKIDKRYILGILNSKLMSYFYAKKYFASHMQGGAFGFDTLSVGSLPIPKLNTKNQKIADKIVNLVDKVLESKAQGKDSTTLPYANATPPCHTTSHFCHTERSEVSQKPHRDLVDSSLSAKAQNDKTIKNCDDKSNHRDISPTAQYDKTNKSQYDTTDLESQIDKLVYQLYDLTHDEIQIIESK